MITALGRDEGRSCWSRWLGLEVAGIETRDLIATAS
jgi:hypothetical protein